MTTTFKNFIQPANDLLENLFIDKNRKVQFTISKTRILPGKDEIDTFFDIKKSTSHVPGLAIYSLFSYKSGNAFEDINDILEAIKGISSSVSIDKATYQSFLKYSVELASGFIKKVLKPDYILYPRSTSPFLADFAKLLKESLPDITFVADAFLKRELNNFQDDETILALIDASKYGEGALTEKGKKELVASIKRTIKSNMEAGKGPIISLKKIFKRHAKFLQNFMELANIETVFEMQGKKILILDDAFSSSATLADMARQAQLVEPVDTVAFTIFKGSSAPSEASKEKAEDRRKEKLQLKRDKELELKRQSYKLNY